MEKIARSVAYLGKNFDGSGQPQDAIAKAQIPLGARMLRVVRDLEAHIGTGQTAGDALRLMHQQEGLYDPSVLAAALACFGEDSLPHLPHVTPVAWASLREGDTLADDIPSQTGSLLLTKGCRVTPNLKRMLQNMATGGGMPETVRIKTSSLHGQPAPPAPSGNGPS
jgi:hypothetical protein